MIIGSIVLLAIIVAVFAQFSTQSTTSKESERIFVQTIRGDSLRKELNDYVQVSDMPPNTSAYFYYPNSKDTEDRDAFQTFQLIRLPVFLDGKDEIPAFRAYSAVDLSSHCLTKYWSQEGRMRIEDPCGGNMYNPFNGALITIGGNPVLVDKNSALPYLELEVDEQGYILAKPPIWREEKNGAIGIGREITSQERSEYQRMVENYMTTLEEKLGSLDLPDTLPTGHKYSQLNENDMTKRTAIYKDPDDGSVVNISYEWCNCTKTASQIKADVPRPHNETISFDNVSIYAYPNHINTVSGKDTQYTFIFYKDGFQFKVKTWMDFDTGSKLVKNIFFS